MKIIDYIWGKISAAILVVYVGAAYGLAASPVIIYFFPQIKVIQVATVFSISFLSIGLISANFIIEAAIGMIHLIAGFLTGIYIWAGARAGLLPSYPFRYVENNGIKKGPIIFILLGIISGVFVVLIYK
jgi:hypothetical protein